MTHWHDQRRSFTLLQVVTLYDNLEDWTGTNPWSRFHFLVLCNYVTVILNKASDIAKNRNVIKLIIHTMSQSTPTPKTYAIGFYNEP